jgi:hypothetical protein
LKSSSVLNVLSLFFSSFKLFLELEPQLRDIIFKFYESKYASCLKLLDEIKVRFYGTPPVESEMEQSRKHSLEVASHVLCQVCSMLCFMYEK